MNYCYVASTVLSQLERTHSSRERRRCNISKSRSPSGRVYGGVSPWQWVVFTTSYDTLHIVYTQSQSLLLLTYSHDASTHMNVAWLFTYTAMLLVLSPILRPALMVCTGDIKRKTFLKMSLILVTFEIRFLGQNVCSVFRVINNNKLP